MDTGPVALLFSYGTLKLCVCLTIVRGKKMADVWSLSNRAPTALKALELLLAEVHNGVHGPICMSMLLAQHLIT